MATAYGIPRCRHSWQRINASSVSSRPMAPVAISAQPVSLGPSHNASAASSLPSPPPSHPQACSTNPTSNMAPPQRMLANRLAPKTPRANSAATTQHPTMPATIQCGIWRWRKSVHIAANANATLSATAPLPSQLTASRDGMRAERHPVPTKPRWLRCSPRLRHPSSVPRGPRKWSRTHRQASPQQPPR